MTSVSLDSVLSSLAAPRASQPPDVADPRSPNFGQVLAETSPPPDAPASANPPSAATPQDAHPSEPSATPASETPGSDENLEKGDQPVASKPAENRENQPDQKEEDEDADNDEDASRPDSSPATAQPAAVTVPLPLVPPADRKPPSTTKQKPAKNDAVSEEGKELKPAETALTPAREKKQPATPESSVASPSVEKQDGEKPATEEPLPPTAAAPQQEAASDAAPATVQTQVPLVPTTQLPGSQAAAEGSAQHPTATQTEPVADAVASSAQANRGGGPATDAPLTTAAEESRPSPATSRRKPVEPQASPQSDDEVVSPSAEPKLESRKADQDNSPLLASPDPTPTPTDTRLPDSAAPDVPLKDSAGTTAGNSTPVEDGSATKAAQEARHDPAERARFVQRVAKAFEAVGERGGTVRLRLSPPELGSLRLEIDLRDGRLNARVEAETPVARNLLLDNLPALRERLSQQEIRVERFDIDLMDRSGRGPGQSGGDPWRNPAQGQNADQGTAPRPAGLRRTTETASPASSAPHPAESGHLNVVI